MTKTCEFCSNTAEFQKIEHYTAKLCCWCYNRERIKRNDETSAQWPDDLALDVAERFPDLVAPDCASLRPAVGKGWLIPVSAFLQSVTAQMLDDNLDIGALQISDIKTNRAGEIDVSFEKYLDFVDYYVDLLDTVCSRSCVKCGHMGAIVRGRDKSEPRCGYCYFR